jgi:uncharacterized protein YdbL (DUF1318 family)
MPENTVKPGFEIEPIKVPEPLPHDPMDAHWQALIAERDKLKEEVERLRERVRFADQDCAAECAGLRGEVERLTEACDGYLGHAAGLRAENAKLVERVSVLREALGQIVNNCDAHSSEWIRNVARVALSRTSEGK